MSPILIVYRDAGALESLFADITVQWTPVLSYFVTSTIYNGRWVSTSITCLDRV